MSGLLEFLLILTIAVAALCIFAALVYWAVLT